jgi:hypothetical protein
MATGNSKAKWNQTVGAESGTQSQKTQVTLQYEGKGTEQAVLATPPAECALLWPENNPGLNRLYYGDNIAILAALQYDPGQGKVNLH